MKPVFFLSPRLLGICVRLSHCLKLLWEHIHIQVVILCVCQRNNSNWNLLHNLSLRQRVEHGQRARDRSSMDCGLWIVNCCASIRTILLVLWMWIESGGQCCEYIRMTLRFVSGLVPSVVGSATYWNLCQFKKQSCRVNHKTQLSPSHTARRVCWAWDSGWVCCGRRGRRGCGCGRGVEKGTALNNSIEKPFESVFTRVCLGGRTALPPRTPLCLLLSPPLDPSASA